LAPLPTVAGVSNLGLTWAFRAPTGGDGFRHSLPGSNSGRWDAHGSASAHWRLAPPSHASPQAISTRSGWTTPWAVIGATGTVVIGGDGPANPSRTPPDEGRRSPWNRVTSVERTRPP